MPEIRTATRQELVTRSATFPREATRSAKVVDAAHGHPVRGEEGLNEEPYDIQPC